MTSIVERRARLAERFPVWEPLTLDAWFDRCAAAYPDRPLVVTDRRTATYAEVVAESRELARGLRELGVRRGSRVGMVLANVAEFVPLKIAIARLGAVAIPFNYLYRRDELAYVLDQSGCEVLVTMDAFSGLDYLQMLDEIVPAWRDPAFAERPAGAAGPEALRRVVVLAPDGSVADGLLSLDGLRELGRAVPGELEPAGHGPHDVADMLYTSGSTGSPKGVLVTHDAVLRTAYASALTRAFGDGRRILFSLPCYHMFGYVEGILSCTFVGGAAIMQTSFSATGYLEGIERHRADDILCVPTMAVAMVEAPDRGRYDLSSLGAVLCGSAPAPVWLWETVRDEFAVSEIVTGYGMTECGGAMTLTLPEDELVLTSTTVGRPKLAGAAGVPGAGTLCTYVTVDPLTGEPLPSGATGELVSAGPTMMIGYHGKPEETAAAMLPDGRVRSGDLGRVDERGYLVLTGRSKELYKSGGELVMPKEVEDVLAAHPAVSQVYAIGLVDERWGEIGCAVVVRVPGATATEADLLAHAKERLARFKVPKRVVFLDAADLPTTPTGKVQKFRLVQSLAHHEGVPS
ncbi:class I adenylate-forming enzyme family protein [Nocardioides zeae]|uniref:AMP-binding protein n=1 Tax=Nocardioides zeae TaxID=1457234 RepID=A0A6P0HGC6_9ACTN|nr:AMP-binding protein [Nocardioides zeae]NEN77621.1 AMP-binding protein [Nocardioides zeae]